MKWGLFGGTFDPIHFGHLRAAEEMMEIFKLNRIIFVPSSRPPHKLEAEITSFYHREQMVRMSIEGNVNFSFSEVENLRAGKSYSVETVEYILNKYMENIELYFEKLLLLCNFAVMTRPGYKNKGLDSMLTKEFAARFVYDKEVDGFKGPTGHTIFFRNTTFLDISSSRIKAMAKTDNSIRYLVPDNVRQYIAKNGIYK
jgi:nicotinate-nucleotide adenylyltransferase